MEPLGTLHEAVTQSLGRIAADPAVMARAAAALDRCVATLGASTWPDVAHRFSGLNADGCPVELAFSSRDRAIRFTSEAAGPEVSEHQRFARAEALLRVLGASALPAAQREDLVAVQDGPLVWGAAVAGCHDEGGDHFKIYVEPALPLERAAPAVISVLRRASLCRVPRLVMIGCDARGRVEHYLRSDGLLPGELARIVEELGLGGCTRRLEEAVELAWQGTADRALEGVWGISVASEASGEVVALSLFKEVNRLLGGDATARQRLLALVRELDAGDFDVYARVSEPLATGGSREAHGMLSFTIARDRPLELRVGLNPLAIWGTR